ncbi:MAG: S8 family serine peptidase, partial [Polyangiaceae bacterium]|nr:S8 family serine peptidase [Polyangiaceae bacterium]
NVRAAGLDGKGVLLGFADSGLDPLHPDFRDENGSRIEWYLDLSSTALGKHPELEAKFGSKGATANLGAIYSKADLDEAILGNLRLPIDSIGHGTHVAGIAASNGGGTAYVGVAPKAGLIAVRVTQSDDSLTEEDLLRAAEFIFDRATEMKKPVVVNLSLGSDFGPHDGSLLWEEKLAAFVGPDKPGRIIVAAAGNSGSIATEGIHQSVRVSAGGTVRVPIQTVGSLSGTVTVWVAMPYGSDLKVGLDVPGVPDWIHPIGRGEQWGRNEGDNFRTGVIYGPGSAANPVPEKSNGAVVLWAGNWTSTQDFAVTLEGTGMAELYLQAAGTLGRIRFAHPVREGTINLPADHPSILAVGCTVNRTSWKGIGGAPASFTTPTLDPTGLLSISTSGGTIANGDVCWFSSAGPNLFGNPKPDLLAPGAGVVASASERAPATSSRSIFSSSQCPKSDVDDKRCLILDATHGLSAGTSMSTPVVSGAAAVLLEADPTLTQPQMRAILQAGAKPIRGAAPFLDQAGAGEIHLQGAIDALLAEKTREVRLPSLRTSWMSANVDYVRADGAIPLSLLFQLRDEGEAPADGFAIERFVVSLRAGGRLLGNPVAQREGPGLFRVNTRIPAGLGGLDLQIDAAFDGSPVVAPRSLAIATDAWNRSFEAKLEGGCAATGLPLRNKTGNSICVTLGLLTFVIRRRRR